MGAEDDILEDNNSGRVKGPIPRSLGAVYEVIRIRLGLSQLEMFSRLEKAKSPYKLRAPKKSSSKSSARSSDARRAQTAISNISNWENSKHNVDFAVQHRYGVVSGTYSGVLHLISLFYANARDAADHTSRDKYLESRAVARGLASLAEYILNNSPSKLPNNMSQSGRIAPEHERFICDCLDAYRRGVEREQ